ncbi:MAG TPA: carboxypeptidase regulatory-like domain-containing protein [Blastocatellia bacterium]|nr:carboxypeptidase regulatory-like domain-containing protein [Blastocatellia bacterium]
MRQLKRSTLTLFLFFSVLAVAHSQTGSTISGTVADSQGAIVPGATITLLDTATNQERKQTTNDAGQYLFTSVQPGVYRITVTMQNFRQAVINSQKIDVGRQYLVNVTLEAGAITERVEVSAGTGAELQKLDATVGNVIGADALSRLPSLSRDATALLNLQPMVTPGRSEGEGTGGQVAGARSDQNTFMVDGGDATSNTEGNGGYNNGFAGTPRAVVPTPAESLEEFRVNTNNPNATFGRSAGAQVNLVTKRGTNEFHGSAYWYHQNDNLNANTFTRNRLGQKDPELKDNRFGLSLGGPIWKDKTFIFGHYEGRRFPQSGDTLRLVPTDTFKAGILRFKNASGVIVSYNLGTSTLCGPANNSPCDPRNKGISPVVKAQLDLLPAGNDSSSGDGLNTIGFRAAAPFSLTEDFGVMRLDHHFSDKWQFMGSYRYGRTAQPSLAQINITGGSPVPTANRPLQPRYVVGGLTGSITPRLTTDFRFNWLRHWWEWATQKPSPLVSGTSAALAIAGEGVNSFIDEPVNIDTQNARGRIWNGRDYTFQDNTTWAKGEHTYQFGGRYTHQNIIHQRDDKVVGGLTSLIYQVTKGTNVLIPDANRPPTCGAGVSSNCLQSGDVTRWNTLYSAMLGIVDRATVLATRNGQLELNAPGTPLREEVKVNAFELFANDIWRIKPSLTLSYGLTYNVQLPPLEKEGKQTLMVDTGNGNKVLNVRDFLKAREAAANAGQVYNPVIGYLPVGETGRKYPYDPDWNNLGPRIAAAWNPSFTSGFMGKLFGDHKSVLRGGYALSYDRINGVGIVMIPILGVGYGLTLTCQGPSIGGQCLGGGGTNPSTAFRIGVDGSTVPLPTIPSAKLPITPGVNSNPEFLSFQIDPKRQVGSSHGWDVTFQRELPWNMLLEVGYVGRVSHGLYQGLDLNQAPFFMKDPKSGQTFAQAFDAVASQLRAGKSPASQAWFENMLKGSDFCAPGCTAGVVNELGGSIQSGAVYDVWRSINDSLITGPAIIDSIEMLYMISDLGRSDYHAGFVTLTKRMSHGLTLGTNYTLSRTRDMIGINQNTLNSATNAYNLEFDFGPAIFDRRHTLNAYWYHQLPFGRGGRWWDKLISGWYTSGIYTYASGLPLDFNQGVCQEFGQGIFGNCDSMVPTKGNFNTSVHKGVVGSGGVGTNAGGGGTGLNYFKNPEEVYNSFRQIRISEDTNQHRGAIRGLGRWNMDLSIGKQTTITERVHLRFSADFTNVFNRVEFSDLFLDFTDPASFGVLNSQYNQPRFIQLGFRVDW